MPEIPSERRDWGCLSRDIQGGPWHWDLPQGGWRIKFLPNPPSALAHAHACNREQRLLSLIWPDRGGLRGDAPTRVVVDRWRILNRKAVQAVEGALRGSPLSSLRVT